MRWAFICARLGYRYCTVTLVSGWTHGRVAVHCYLKAASFAQPAVPRDVVSHVSDVIIFFGGGWEIRICQVVEFGPSNVWCL